MPDPTISRVVSVDVPRAGEVRKQQGPPPAPVTVAPEANGPPPGGEASEISAAARRAARDSQPGGLPPTTLSAPPAPPPERAPVEHPTDVALRDNGRIATGATVSRGAGGALMMELPSEPAPFSGPGGPQRELSPNEQFAHEAQLRYFSQAGGNLPPLPADSKTPFTDIATRQKAINDDGEQSLLLYATMAADRASEGKRIPTMDELREGKSLAGTVAEGDPKAAPLAPRSDGQPHTLTEIAGHAFKTNGSIPIDAMTILASTLRAPSTPGFAPSGTTPASTPQPAGPTAEWTPPTYVGTPLTDTATIMAQTNDDIQAAHGIYMSMARERMRTNDGLDQIFSNITPPS